MLTFDSVVIGAGVSGMTAAIYLKRANLNVLLVEKNVPGGQINRSSTIENYPGFKKIDGPTLSMNIFEQVTNLNVEYMYGKVEEIKQDNNEFALKINDKIIKTKTVIIATGRAPRELNLANEKELVGRGISYCALCDGMFFKDKSVAVVGAGNSALEEALYLAKICKEVYIIVRKQIKADKFFQDKIKEKSNIFVKYGVEIKELIKSENKLSSLLLSDESFLNVEGLFVYIGSLPNSDVFKDLKIEEGYIIVDKNMKTSISGVFACGDVISKEVYQLTTCVAEGALAANSAIKHINKE